MVHSRDTFHCFMESRTKKCMALKVLSILNSHPDPVGRYRPVRVHLGVLRVRPQSSVELADAALAIVGQRLDVPVN